MSRNKRPDLHDDDYSRIRELLSIADEATTKAKLPKPNREIPKTTWAIKPLQRMPTKRLHYETDTEDRDRD